MARFFFRLHCHPGAADVEVVDLPDQAAARREAFQACGDLIREADGVAGPSRWEMEVRTEDDLLVVALRVTLEDYVSQP